MALLDKLFHNSSNDSTEAEAAERKLDSEQNYNTDNQQLGVQQDSPMQDQQLGNQESWNAEGQSEPQGQQDFSANDQPSVGEREATPDYSDQSETDPSADSPRDIA